MGLTAAEQMFQQIASEEDLRKFLIANEFRLADSRSHPDQFVLAVFKGKLEGKDAKVIHRLLDEAMARKTGTEKNSLILEIAGCPAKQVDFSGLY